MLEMEIADQTAVMSSKRRIDLRGDISYIRTGPSLPSTDQLLIEVEGGIFAVQGDISLEEFLINIVKAVQS
jgi:hypothetical protein